MLDPEDTQALTKLSAGDSSLSGLDQDRIERLEAHLRSEPEAEQKRILVLEAQIGELKESGQHRVEQVRLLQQAAISWDSFPSEMLSEIFLHLRGKIHFPVDGRDIVWTLSRVCSAWRGVVITEQRLWTDLYLRFEPTKQGDHSLTIMSDILHRSGNQQLSLTLNGRKIPWDQALVSVPFFSVVVTHTIDRVTSLTLIDVDPDALDELYSVVEGLHAQVFQQVNELKITPDMYRRRSSADPDRSCPAADLTRRMANVTKLVLGGPPECISCSFPEHMDYPWSRLQEIVLLKYQPSVGEVLEILSETRALRAFKTQIGTDDNMGSTNWDPVPNSVRLPMLEELDLLIDLEYPLVERPHGVVFNALFAPLHMPRLSKLKISSTVHHGGWFHLHMTEDDGTVDAIDSLYSLKSLTSLELNGCFTVDIGILLQELPRLEHLSVHPASANALTRPTITAIASGVYGTNLHTLDCCVLEKDAVSFLEMLEQQWTSALIAASLECIHRAHAFIDYNASYHGLTIAKLNKLARKLKQDLGGKFEVEFFPLRARYLTDDDDFEYNSYF